VLPAVGPAWHIVEIVDTLDVERDVVLPFNEGQIATGIRYAWEVDDPAL
jgi:hypothetical protein